MSVLKIKRNESKDEFVYTANQIFIELAHEVLDNTEKANSIFPSDELRKKIKKIVLLVV